MGQPDETQEQDQEPEQPYDPQAPLDSVIAGQHAQAAHFAAEAETAQAEQPDVPE